MITIDPRGIEMIEWVDLVTLELEPFGDIPELLDPKDWRDWARAVLQNVEIASVQPPDPGFFADWREWAERFNQTIYGLNRQ